MSAPGRPVGGRQKRRQQRDSAKAARSTRAWIHNVASDLYNKGLLTGEPLRLAYGDRTPPCVKRHTVDTGKHSLVDVFPVSHVVREAAKTRSDIKSSDGSKKMSSQTSGAKVAEIGRAHV